MPVVMQRLAVCQHVHIGADAFKAAGPALLATSIDRKLFLKQQQQHWGAIAHPAVTESITVCRAETEQAHALQ